MVHFTWVGVAVVLFIDGSLSQAGRTKDEQQVVGYVSSKLHLSCPHNKKGDKLTKLSWHLIRADRPDATLAMYMPGTNGKGETTFFPPFDNGRVSLNVKTGMLIVNNATLDYAGLYHCRAFASGEFLDLRQSRVAMHAVPVDVAISVGERRHVGGGDCVPVALDKETPRLLPLVCSARSLPAARLHWDVAAAAAAVNVSAEQRCHTDSGGMETCERTATVDVERLDGRTPVTCLVTYNDQRREMYQADVCVVIVPRGGRGVWIIILVVALVLLCLLVVLLIVWVVRLRRRRAAKGGAKRQLPNNESKAVTDQEEKTALNTTHNDVDPTPDPQTSHLHGLSKPVSTPVSEPVSEPISEPVSEPVSKPVSEPV